MLRIISAALLENQESKQLYAKRQLEDALASFEQASVFTIHGFCHRMLKEYLFEADVCASLGENEEGIPPSLYARLIKDFFRTMLSENLVSYGQLKLLLNDTKGVEGLEKVLFLLMTKGIGIAPVKTIQELFTEFCHGMNSLKQELNPTPKHIHEDFLLQAPFYTGICNQQKKPKEENVAKVTRFADLFAKDMWELADFDVLIPDGLYLVEAFDLTNLGKKKQPPEANQLHIPELIPKLVSLLLPCVKVARNPHFILAALGYKCREMVSAYLRRKEIVGFDDLLTYMDKAVQQPAFVAKVRKRYTTAIIDEFQDTDPIQWRIFKTLFLSEELAEGRLYLVGDPKQSIYGFRQADIYTYLSAGNALGDGCRASLDTNYRSTEPLVQALNFLFSSETVPGLIALPHLRESLPYRPVKSGGKVAVQSYDDNRGAVHFFAFKEAQESKSKKLAEAEELYLLPFIVKELQQLHGRGVLLSSCAVLVADRFQASRLGSHLKGLEFLM